MNPTFFIALAQGDPGRRRAQRDRLPHPPLRGRAGRDRPRDRGREEDSSTTRSTNQTKSILWALCEAQAASSRNVKVDRTHAQAEGQHHRRVLGDDHRGRRQLPAAALPRGRGRRVRHPARHRVAPLHDLGEPLRHQAAQGCCAASTSRKYGLGELGTWGVAKKRGDAVGRRARDRAALPDASPHACGLYDYHLPDMDEIAEIAPRPTTTTTSAAAKATWRSAS